MKNRMWFLWGASCILCLLVGTILGRAKKNATLSEDTRVQALERQAESHRQELVDTQDELEKWKAQALLIQRTPRPAQDREPDTEDHSALAPATADSIRAGLAEVANDGDRMLALLSELASLDEAHYPEVAEHWIALTNLDAAALDALGLSRLQLATALVQEQGLMLHALTESSLDPTFRRFTAEALEEARVATRRAILDDLDFSNEKDKGVLHPLVRATRDFKDPIYVDRYLHLVERTDLYNNSRQNIAFMIAEIGGSRSRIALDALHAAGGHERILPVLESIYAPPATGLLITNARGPDDDRIGLNDIILEYNERPIRSNTDLVVADSSTRPGDVIAVKVLRNGVELTIYVTVTDTAPGHLHFDATSIRKNL